MQFCLPAPKLFFAMVLNFGIKKYDDMTRAGMRMELHGNALLIKRLAIMRPAALISLTCLLMLLGSSYAAQLSAYPGQFTLSNTVIDVGQISVANTVISAGSGGPYYGEWVWVLGNGANQTINNEYTNSIYISSGPRFTWSSPSGNLIYVTTTTGIDVVNALSNTTVDLISTGGEALSPPAFDPAGTLAYVPCCEYSSTNVIKTVNLQTGSIVNTITFVSQPGAVAINPHGTYLYVSNGVPAIAVVNTLTNTIVGSIQLSGIPSAFAPNPSGSLLYVGVPGNAIAVFNTTTYAQVNTISVSGTTTEIIFNSQGTVAYAINYNAGYVSVINTASNSITGTISGLSHPIGDSLNPSGTIDYGGTATGLDVHQIDAATNSLLPYISAGGNVYGTYVSPNGSLVYADSYTSDNLIIITPPESALQILPAAPQAGSSMQMTINAVSTNLLSFTFNGVTYTENTVSKTVYGTWDLYGFAQDAAISSSSYPGNSLLMSNGITINPPLIDTNVIASNVTIAQGQYETLTGVWSGGTPPYSVSITATNSINGNVLGQVRASDLSSNSESFTFQVPSSSNSLGIPTVELTVSDSASTAETNSTIYHPIAQVKQFAPTFSLGLCYAYKFAGQYYLSSAAKCNATGSITSSGNQAVASMYINGNFVGNTIQYSTNTFSYPINLIPGTYQITFNTLGDGNYVYGGVTDLLNIINSSTVMGINGGPYWWGYTAYDYNLMAAANVLYIRMDVLAPPYPAFASQIANMTSHGFKIIGILDYNTVCGAGVNCDFTLAQWDGAVANAVTDYPQIHIWEIWNEPQYGYAQMGYITGGIPYNYSKMVEGAAPLIRAHNATDQILCFGGDNIYSGGDTYDAAFYKWAQQVWSNLTAANAVSDCNAISLHAYTNYYGWQLNQTAGGQYTIANVFNQSLAAYESLTSKPIWITEYGMPYDNTCHSVPCNYSSQYEFDSQAAGLFLSHLYVKAVTVFNLNTPSWALINSTTEKPNPAFYGYRNFSEMMANLNTSGYTVPSLGAASPTTQVVDQDQNAIINDSGMSGGATPYTYQWEAGFNYVPTLTPANAVNADSYLGLGTQGGNAESQNALFATNSQTQTGTYYFILNATDMHPTSQRSATLEVVVNPQLLANPITPANPALDDGQSITLAVNALGGTPPYHYQWYSAAGTAAPACTAANSIAGATSSTYSASPTSSTSYAYLVTDSATKPASECSSGDTVTINPAMKLSSFTVSNTVLDYGQYVTLTATLSAYSGPYVYNFLIVNSTTGSVLSSVLRSTSSTSGSATFQLTSAYSGNSLAANVVITNATSGVVNSLYAGLELNNQLSAGPITSTSASVSSGQGVTLTAHPYGGTFRSEYVYVPITIINSQPSPTPANFQQELTINSLQYHGYISANWTNVEFTDSPASGNALHAWIESNPHNTSTNTIVWVLLSNSIAASSNEVIYMDFMNSTVMSANGPTGEAPQLSSAYGEYDDGGKVFSFYDNFEGTSLNSKWDGNAVYGASIAVDNGLTLNSGTSSTLGSASITSATPITTTNSIIDALMNIYGTASGHARDRIHGTVTGLGIPDFGMYGNSGYPLYYDGAFSSNLVSIGNSAKDMNLMESEAFAPNGIFTWSSYNNGSKEFGLSTTYSIGTPYTIEFDPTYDQQTRGVENIQYILVHAYPPNGTMPSAAYGPVSALVSNIYNYQWYEGSSCTSPISGATSNTYLAQPSYTTTYSYAVMDFATTPSSACSTGYAVTTSAQNPSSGGTSASSGGSGGGNPSAAAPIRFTTNETEVNGYAVFDGHKIKISTSGNVSIFGYHLYNQTQYDTHTLELGGKNITISINFITPTTAGISINGVPYTLFAGNLISINDPIYIDLASISYLPIGDTVDLNIFAIGNGTSTNHTTIPSSSVATTTIPQPTTTSAATTSTPISVQPRNATGTENRIISAFAIVLAVVVIAGVAYYLAVRRRIRRKPPSATLT